MGEDYSIRTTQRVSGRFMITDKHIQTFKGWHAMAQTLLVHILLSGVFSDTQGNISKSCLDLCHSVLLH